MQQGKIKSLKHMIFQVFFFFPKCKVLWFCSELNKNNKKKKCKQFKLQLK